MSDLNDLFKQLAEAKSQDPVYQKNKKLEQEIKENATGDLGSLFGRLAEAKTQDPTYQKVKKIEDQVKESVKADLGSLFSELASLHKQKAELIEEQPQLAEVPLEEPVVEITEEVITEVAPLPTPIGTVPAEAQLPNVDKYLKNAPKIEVEPDSLTNQYKQVNDKIKFLERWIGQIQNAGPGSGEVNLRYLDDVDRSTIMDGNYLTYNAETKKFEFREVTGGGGVAQVQSDWNEADNAAKSFIKNKPTLFSGSYDDLTDTPSIPDAQIQSDWAQADDTIADFIKNKPTALSEFINDISSISWTNPSPNPSDNFKTIVSANDGTMTITYLTGLPGMGGSKTWTIDEDKITFPDNSEQTTAAVPQIQSDWNQTTNTALDFIKNKPTIPDITNIEDTLAATGEPMGHEDRAQSTISFNATTRTFTITPVAANFEVWVRGTKHTYTTAQSVTIPNTSGIYYIYFDSNGLGAQTDFFIWDEQAPTALVYYNAVTGLAPYFADERHGTTLDWQTHEYLHRTRGAVIANGFSVGSYTIGGEVQLDIANGTFFDEDLQIDVTHSNTPTVNTWQQDLQGPAQIPMFYLSGTGWVRDNPTGYLNKQGTSRPRYNSLSGGVWSVADIDANKYGTTFIVATNNLTYPIIAIMSQSSHANQGDAEALEFSDLVLTGFPVAEFRLLYKVVFKADSTHGHLTSVWDLRQLSATTPSAAIGSDHGLLSGLGDDDHPQYLLRTDATSITSVGTLDVLGVAYAPSTTSGAAVQLTAKDTQGGIGWADFLKLTTTVAGATNPTKWIRLSSTGTLEVVNNAYSASIFALSDSGDLSVPGKLQVGGKQAVNGPAFSVYRNSNATIPTDVLTLMSWTTEEYDTAGCMTSTRFTPNVEGYYSLVASVRMDGDIGTGERMISIKKNGNEYRRGFNTQGTASVGTSWFQMEVNCHVYANGSTDYFEVFVQHGAGVNRNTTAGQPFTSFQGCMLRGA